MFKEYIPHLLILVIAIQIVVITNLIGDICQHNERIEAIKPTLTNTDTIYKEIEVLKYRQDTIKIYYEKKINDYRILPTPERVQLFSERINRR